ncbi:MAG: glycosyltransferase family 1 protein [Gemmatimonadaceae bacterium]|nr:glycosyltransferase family 1 protein [Gemmatimonadaceae bacterium]
MHLVIVTSGSRGDVQPYLALALRAMRGGHRVTLATHDVFRTWVEGQGVTFRSLHGDPKGMLSAPGARAWLSDGSRVGLLRFAREFGREFTGLFDGLLADMTAVTADADLIVHGMVCMAASQLHEIRGTPVMGGWLAPLTPTRAFPVAGLTCRAPRSGWEERRNWISHLVGEQLLWQPSRTTVNRWRRGTLHTTPLPFLGPFSAQRTASYPVCYAYSPTVLPRPADWPEWIAPTGWWTLDEPAFAPSAALSGFLDAGDAPVTIGFGSMTPQDCEWLTRVVLDACERAECRAILLQGWGTLGQAAMPTWAHVEPDVPHGWLYPRSSAIVHHGGAGTTGAAVRSGVPQVIVPLGFDQQFWGSRLHEMGVSPPPIRRRDLTASRLASAIRIARTDARLRDAAAALGDVVRREDGTGVALARIEAHLARSG